MFTNVNGVLFNTVSFGTGRPTIVAQGGWTGSWEMWLQPFERLSRSMRCVAFDHRGAGETVAPPETITAEQMADDLIGVMDKLDIEQCVLAAESMGTLIAMLAAERHPDRFLGLVLVSAVREITPGSTEGLVVGSRADYRSTVHSFVEACVPETDSEHLKRWGRNMLNRAEPESAARIFEGSYGTTVNPAAIRQPTLLVHGDRDVIASASDASKLASAIPNSEFHLLSGAGHVPSVTMPDALVDIFEDWLHRQQILE